MGLLSYLNGFGGGDVAVDLGTANTVVFVRGQGIALFEPSVIAVDDYSGEVLAVGNDAKRMIGRTPAAIRATRPLRHGVIADFDVTEQMLRHFIRKAIGSRIGHPRAILCVPSGITDVESRAVEEATLAAGAREAYLIEEPMAAAIGADVAVGEPAGNLIVDVGGGTTEVAVISLGGMVVWESLRVGGYEMDDAIVGYMKKEHGLAIGEESAEEVKIEIGSAWDLGTPRTAEVRGRDLVTGLLKRVGVSSNDVRAALDPAITRIVDAVKETLERTPPELAADVVERGVVLVGGGSLLHGFRERVRAETELPVHLVASPLTCVAEGAGRSLEEFEAVARSAQARRDGWRGRKKTVASLR